ncbi:hypothetical protein C4D60_Mb07t19290 [Musa balbisiana]|uniref:Uncharacterized protein n=1 Tax=Musa balbisiana TaxID=52838 RepID=A0A4S8JHP1_MUSBA|nr:hypothetical protein C4D60_Mb07t19290 [Musa balbisiana]
MKNTAMEEDPRSNVSSSRERYAEFMKDSCCARYFLGPNPSIARFVYALIFLVTCLLAWTVRDYGRNALSELESWSSSLRACFLPAWHCNHTISLLLCRTQRLSWCSILFRRGRCTPRKLWLLRILLCYLLFWFF